jgi:hypothetical protein
MMLVHTSSVEAPEDVPSGPRQFDVVITDQTMPMMTGNAWHGNCDALGLIFRSFSVPVLATP